jgi:hypothetical protein
MPMSVLGLRGILHIDDIFVASAFLSSSLLSFVQHAPDLAKGWSGYFTTGRAMDRTGFYTAKALRMVQEVVLELNYTVHVVYNTTHV